MANRKTAAEIEREIEREREGLSASVSELQSRFSADEIVAQVGRHLQTHGSEMGQAFSKSAKQNPIGLTLTAAGLAWMVFGRSYDDEDKRLAGDPLSRQLRKRRPAAPTERAPSGSDWAARKPGYGTSYRPSYYDDLHLDDGEESDTFGDRVARTQARLKAGFEEGRHNAAATAGVARAKAGEAGHTARDSISAKSAQAQSVLEDGYDRIASGTERMSESARRRVIEARERALIARERAGRKVQRAGASAADFFGEHPLVAGALAIAAGAALGGAAPRTKAEDDFMGEYSDGLFAEAEAIFHEERDKLAAVADAALDEGQSIAREARAEADERTPGDKPAEHALADAAKSAGKRVEDRVRDEAEAQKLGRPDVTSDTPKSDTPKQG
ncbi:MULTISPECIES: DUF3618 domain-containing protein [unclassified Salipiger]|uniref:DUF3618 domain-containing protein n=1 Tax=unclassified Salipiger TaxID=2640570 RepID=UPI0013BAA344|nr:MULTISPECIES: DUF3618 domain-containing protein [unclassified Salipiger]NDV49026.1 DUF3618 domain-containing protein [Salipiger sp. PrR003]NDW31286.1 DUF3618 domain-containing protein [Salipiger sp. PrR007]